MTRKIDTAKLIEIAKALMVEREETGFMSVTDGEVHVYSLDDLTDVAPMSEWAVNLPRVDGMKYPYRHEAEIDGVKFFAITEDSITIPEPC